MAEPKESKQSDSKKAMGLKDLLPPELYDAVRGALKGKGRNGADAALLVNDGSYIPIARYNALKERANGLEASMAAAKEGYAEKLSALQLAHGLAAAKVKNPATVKALIDYDALTLTPDGTLAGLSEQLERLRESDAYLFEDGHSDGVRGFGTGAQGNFARQPRVLGPNPWAAETFNLTEQGRILTTKPELAKRLMESAGQ